ncbi:hypothetical protein HPB48_026419 [Haemaphysalis longicornis]|uniref:Uncharacterized protein n=1 Tax=Haemaphysalis longicornis TaxID=44386 RepID=A0A9J6HAQ1_HAELO|nr:hypothetical protein HPB48_026419 [Haemaphysalis longicornis]
MTNAEKVRCLLQGLRPEMMERIAITNPKTPKEFLAHLQRLTHVGFSILRNQQAASSPSVMLSRVQR